MKIVILMAGVGSRLGHGLPKALTPLRHGQTILDHQLGNLAGVPGEIVAVVGFQQAVIMAQHPELTYVRNSRYAQTNTARSLACALSQIDREDVLWLNGDVVFDRHILDAVLNCAASSMAVVNGPVDDEAIKYSLNGDGTIRAVSKAVVNSPGEAIGINLVRAADLALFKAGLDRCTETDYFERGLELAIETGMIVQPVDVTAYPCVEVDSPTDLEAARKLLSV